MADRQLTTSGLLAEDEVIDAVMRGTTMDLRTDRHARRPKAESEGGQMSIESRCYWREWTEEELIVVIDM